MVADGESHLFAERQRTPQGRDSGADEGRRVGRLRSSPRRETDWTLERAEAALKEALADLERSHMIIVSGVHDGVSQSGGFPSSTSRSSFHMPRRICRVLPQDAQP